MNTKLRFNVNEFKNRAGSKSFRVSGYNRDGNQVRKNFTDLTEAKIFAQKYEREFLGLPEPTLVSAITQLNDAQLRQAETCFSLLSQKMPTKTPLDAVQWFLDNYRETAIKMPLTDAFTKFIEEKSKLNRRPDTIRDLEDRVGRFCRRHPAKNVSDVRPDDIGSFIDQGKKSGVSKNNDRRVLSGFFNWAAGKGYCAESPVATIEPIKTDRDEPEVLSLADARKLVTAAHTIKEGICEPCIILGLFCAIRPTEIGRLTWDDIDLESKTVTIGAKLAKMRQRRIVAISDNAVEFLMPHAIKKTALRGTNFRSNYDAVKKAAGFGGREGKRAGSLKPLSADVLRHTAISMHLETHQHEGKTAVWAGNSPDIIQRHYKGLVKAADAKEFWSITPASLAGNVIPMDATAVA